MYDNASTDGTAAIARAQGADVRLERRVGKGSVIRRALADIDADVYVLIDGDAEFDLGSLGGFVDILLDGHLDHVTGVQMPVDGHQARPGHRVGNHLLSRTVGILFGSEVGDLLSGCRVLSRRFARSFPATSTGFEIETELTVHALRLGVPMAELPMPYRGRPDGSISKLRTVRDGLRIMGAILRLVVLERPLAVFGLTGTALALASVGLGAPLILEFLATSGVPRFPTAILAAGLGTTAVICLVAGLLLDAIRLARHEAKRLAYLAVPRDR